MSRSNPDDKITNPSTCWLEWHGTQGDVFGWDKELKQEVRYALPFTFLLLDELKTVRGWHEKSKSRIYSNEVRDMRTQPLIVRAWKGGTLIEGIYNTIKPRVEVLGGDYHSSIYIAYKKDDEYRLGNLALKGSAVKAWFEFRKERATDIYSKAIKISGYTDEQSGKVIFRVPVFTLVEISRDAESAALKLDTQLQTYLKSYQQRDTDDQADAAHDEQPPVPVEDIPF